MAKKNKQQKIISRYRKKIKLLEQLSITQNKKSSSQKLPTAESDKKEQQKNPPLIESKEKAQSGKIYFFKDLNKSAFIILLIITLEFIIYFVRIKTY
ncbi:hypothetical protein A2774_00410 [Candidatus Roizmanbacteria bacterium RIFCSPHIGHO2_01_FULL_39_12c]|uniref:Uncharacterized protein n=1 Tax=Candidatus Roizmanbacteria bacterium RIFCSPHIGHO2_01_FULL_39_12c TaxID=1802031 RepID=A0A1F7GDM8_9BACT|nr:MAG: hypothetical protein A2774_00410 [Candidatus Roizmanbacteria bacterium RIFCSPHIGHO2_01_FULL_39_12c]